MTGTESGRLQVWKLDGVRYYMENNDTFGSRVKALRKSRKLTQDELANALGVTKGTVSVWERNGRKPDFQTLEDICTFFDVNLGYLICADSTQTLTMLPNDLDENPEAVRLKNLEFKLSQLSEKSLLIVEVTINAAYKADNETGKLKPGKLYGW